MEGTLAEGSQPGATSTFQRQETGMTKLIIFQSKLAG
jgi:hypothetical protein